MCVWSSAVNHRFDFAYLEDAVTSAITTPLSFFPAPLLRPYTYQLLRLVLILSLSCLYLAVHTKPKTCLPSLNQWHLPSLPPLFCSSRFWRLKPGRMHFRTSQFGFLRKYISQQTDISILWHRQWVKKDDSGKSAGRVENGRVPCLTS